MKPFRLHGLMQSYFSRKMTGYFEYKGIPYVLRRFYGVSPESAAAGFPGGVPAVETPEGDLMWDSTSMIHHLELRFAGSPREKWAALTTEALPRIGSCVDVEMLKQEADAMEFNVTGCRYADFFRQLGEPELGAVLLCEVDDHQVEVGSPEVEFTRTQTIMKGGSYCDFRYRMMTAGGSKPGAV